MFNTLIKIAFITLLLAFGANSAKSISLLRDPDIERGLQELANPILKVAGINSRNFKIYVVNSPSLNAFVIDNNHIFIHSGLLLKLNSASQVQAVIAHEAAHIANGHITRRIAAAKKTKMTSTFGALVAIAAAAGGQSQAGFGIAMGTAASAKRILLAHSRNEESSADQSAIRYMNNATINSSAMIEVFKMFEQQVSTSLDNLAPYTRSHPLDRDRIRAIRTLVAKQSNHPINLKYQYWFSRIHAKLSSFIYDPEWTLNQLHSSNYLDLLKKAVASHRIGQAETAIKSINELLITHPNDPYFFELKGQILLENRRYSAAIIAYQTAAELEPKNALILGGYGRALLTHNNENSNKKALKVLKIARNLDNKDTNILRYLGAAFTRSGRQGEAILTVAERYALNGDVKNAILQAKRAEVMLPRGSSAWQSAQNIIYGP